jgi:hypothetical protein
VTWPLNAAVVILALFVLDVCLWWLVEHGRKP